MSEQIKVEQVNKALARSNLSIDLHGRECTKCLKYKDWSHYGKNKASATKHMSKCKECIKDYTEKTKDHKKEYDLNYNEKYSEKVRQRKSNYYINKKDYHLEKMSKYREENREEINEQKRKYREENKEKINAQKRSTHAKELRKANRKLRWESDVSFKLTDLLRSRLSHAVKSQGAVKAFTTLSLVGCSLSDLKLHLESQWVEGMTWKNHSLKGWSIDHIRPCASFDLTDPEQQKECFHYTNLQPLWSIDNMIKGAKYTPTP